MNADQFVALRHWARKLGVGGMLLCMLLYGGPAFSQQPKDLDSLLNLLGSLPKDTQRVNVLNQICFINAISEPDSAPSYCHEALKLSEELSFSDGKSTAYRHLGTIARFKGKEVDAIGFFKQALKLDSLEGDLDGLSSNYGSLALVYNEFSDFRRSIEYINLAIDVGASQGNEFKTAKLKLVAAVTYNDMGNLEMSRKYCTEALEVFERQEKVYETKAACNCLGISYRKSGNLKRSLFYHRKALEVAEKVSWDVGKESAYTSMGNTLTQMENFEGAREAFNKALKINRKLKDRKAVAKSYFNLAYLHESMGEYEKAIELFDSCQVISYQFGLKDYLRDISNFKARIYDKKDLKDSALKYLRLQIVYADSIHQAEKEAITSRMDALHKVKVAELDNQALENQKTNVELKLRNQNLLTWTVAGGSALLISLALLGFGLYRSSVRARQVELEQQAFRAQMNPHFIFNSLNSIQKYFLTNDHEQASEYLASFGELMRRILDFSGNARVSLADDLKALELYISLENVRLEGRLDYQIEVDGAISKETIMIPPLVIQPFVENAIWHGISPLKTGGHISIRLYKKDGRLFACIEDSGVGMPKGLDWENKKGSQGMTITRQRIKDLKVESLSPGTRITLEIPYK